MNREKPVIAGNTSTGWLKLIALVFMCCDHFGKMLFGNLPELRLLGRIAFPLYCWCMVIGICYTKCPWKYILRVAVVGLISQPLNMLALNHTWTEPCVFLTLTLGLCALWGMREKRFFSHIWAPVLCMLLAVITKTDYGWRGILLMIFLYMAKDSRGGIAAAMVGIALFWGTFSSNVSTLFGFEFADLYFIPGLKTILPSFLRLQTFMLLALPLMLIRIPRAYDLRMPRWVGYAVYPLHLIVLYLLELQLHKAMVFPIDLWTPIAALLHIG